METQIYTKIPSVNLEIHARNQKIASRVMGGKALYNDRESRFTFVENERRKRRSRLITTTDHATLRRRDNGTFSITLTFTDDEKRLSSSLTSELRHLLLHARSLSLHKNQESKTKNQ